MSESNLQFGKYVKQRRESLGKTMRSFAEEVGISPAYLSDIENGHRNPPEKKLEDFIRALCITETEDIHKFYNLAGEKRGGQHSDINDYMERVPQSRFVLRTAKDQNWTDADWQRLLEMFEGKKIITAEVVAVQFECQRKSNGLPILSKLDIENIATKVLKEFAPMNLECPLPFKTTSFLEDYHQLVIKNKYIGTFESGILGLTVMGEEARIPTFDEMYRPVVETEYYGTVYISPSLMGRDNLPRRRYTEAHEGSHKLLHQEYFDNLAKTSCGENKQYVACRSVELYNPKNNTDHDWMEWHADSLAAALLMPRDVFYDFVRSEIRKAGISCGYLVKGQQRDKRVFYEIVDEIAKRFHVSHKATQIRMAHVGLIKTNPWY